MRLRVRIVSLTVVAAASGAAPGDLLTAQQLLAALLLPSVRNDRTLIGSSWAARLPARWPERRMPRRC